MPTVPIIAPPIAICMRDEGSMRAQIIRNTSPFNYFDRPSISIPIQEPGSAPVGLMLVGRRDDDWKLLAMARAFEKEVNTGRESVPLKFSGVPQRRA